MRQLSGSVERVVGGTFAIELDCIGMRAHIVSTVVAATSAAGNVVGLDGTCSCFDLMDCRTGLVELVERRSASTRVAAVIFAIGATPEFGGFVRPARPIRFDENTHRETTLARHLNPHLLMTAHGAFALNEPAITHSTINRKPAGRKGVLTPRVSAPRRPWRRKLS